MQHELDVFVKIDKLQAEVMDEMKGIWKLLEVNMKLMGKKNLVFQPKLVSQTESMQRSMKNFANIPDKVNQVSHP